MKSLILKLVLLISFFFALTVSIARAQTAPDPCIAVTTTTDTVPPGVSLTTTWTQSVSSTPASSDAPTGFYLQVDTAPEVQYVPASFTTCPDTKRGYLWTSLPTTLSAGNHALKVTAYNSAGRGTATIRNFTVLTPAVIIPGAPLNIKIQPTTP